MQDVGYNSNFIMTKIGNGFQVAVVMAGEVALSGACSATHWGRSLCPHLYSVCVARTEIVCVRNADMLLVQSDAVAVNTCRHFSDYSRVTRRISVVNTNRIPTCCLAGDSGLMSEYFRE